jgi:stage III sporulation protein AB
MWLKLAGTALILTASLGYVFTGERRLLEQKKQLEEFRLLLSVMEQEICALRLPLPLVLEHGSEQFKDPYASLCRDVSRILREQRDGDACGVWQRELANMRQEFLLDDTQFGLLFELGQVLRMDQMGMKEDLFSVYRQRLQAMTDTYEAGLLQRRRICRYGGILAGIFLIIMFL